MYRLILATLMVGLLGCGSDDESQPQASSGDEKSASTPAQVDVSEVDKLIADGKRLFDKKKIHCRHRSIQ